MPKELTKREKKIVKLAQSGGTDKELFILNEIDTLEDKVDTVVSEVKESFKEAVEDVNDSQKHVLSKKISNYFDLHNETLKDKTIALWGLSFKPETDDMREAPSVEIINDLVKAGAKIRVHDPKAMEESKKLLSDVMNHITFCDDSYDVFEGADAFAVLTEWHSYRQPDFKRIKEVLKKPVIFDGRNMYNPVYVRSLGLEYFGIGRL